MTLVVVLGAIVLLVVIVLVRASKRRLFKGMVAHVNSIQLAIYSKLLDSFYEQGHDPDRSRYLAAAVTNKLFAKPPQHDRAILELAEELAREVVQTDQEVRYAALMSLRTLMAVDRRARRLEATRRVTDTIEWMKQFWELPPDSPEPELMKQLSQSLLGRISENTFTLRTGDAVQDVQHGGAGLAIRLDGDQSPP